MNILVIGNPYLVSALREEHAVVTVGMGNDYDLTADSFFCDIEKDILQKLPSQFGPDLILLFEGPQQLFPLGLERISIPLGWHVMDSHVNESWHFDYAHLFDFIFVSQKDFCDRYEKETQVPVMYSPLTCDPAINCAYDSEKKYESVFVGTVADDYFDRVEYLKFFQSHLDLKVFSNVFGKEMNEIFNQSKIILNHPVNNDVNFRVFEALASGSLLITPRTDNGLEDLFVDGEELVLFDPNNLAEGVEKVHYYLHHAEERERIAKKGLEKVQAFHSRMCRAREIVDFVKKHELQRKPLENEIYKRLGKVYYVLDQLVFSFSKSRRYAGQALQASGAMLAEYTRIEQKDPEGYHLLGMCCSAQKTKTVAQENFKKAIAIDPTFLPSRIGLGVLAMAAHLHDEALDHFRQAFAIDVLRSTALLESMYVVRDDAFSGYMCIGHIFLNMKMVPESIRYFEKARMLNDAHLGLLESLGFAYLKNNNKERAHSCLMRALDLNPDNQAVMKMLTLANKKA